MEQARQNPGNNRQPPLHKQSHGNSSLQAKQLGKLELHHRLRRELQQGSNDQEQLILRVLQRNLLWLGRVINQQLR